MLCNRTPDRRTTTVRRTRSDDLSDADGHVLGASGDLVEGIDSGDNLRIVVGSRNDEAFDGFQHSIEAGEDGAEAGRERNIAASDVAKLVLRKLSGLALREIIMHECDAFPAVRQ